MLQQFDAALGSLEGYARLVASGLGFMLAAMLLVFLLYRVVSSLIKPRGKVARMVRVAFGAVYVLINADWFGTRDALVVTIARRLNTTEGLRPVVRELALRGPETVGLSAPGP